MLFVVVNGASGTYWKSLLNFSRGKLESPFHFRKYLLSFAASSGIYLLFIKIMNILRTWTAISEVYIYSM